MRRLLILASAIIFLDVTFYAAITPLLPTYVDDLDLGKAEAGILTASYRGRNADRLDSGRFRRRPGRAAPDRDQRPAAARRLQRSSSASPSRSSSSMAPVSRRGSRAR